MITGLGNRESSEFLRGGFDTPQARRSTGAEYEPLESVVGRVQFAVATPEGGKHPHVSGAREMGRDSTAFGIAIPQFVDDDSAISQISAFVRRAEELECQSAWVMDGIVTDQPCLEPIPLLSYVAAGTERIRLGLSVLLLPLRHPVLLAKMLATLDQLSHGRLIVGVGLGENTTPYAVFGGSRSERVQRLEEGVEVMRRLWTESRTSFLGQFTQLDEIPLEPKPRQSDLPLWFGGRTSGALRRAVKLGDGWMGAGAATTSDFAVQAAHVRALLEQRDRSDHRSFSIAKRCYVVLESSRAAAVERVRPFFGAIYGQPALADRVVVGGTVDECVTQLEDVRRAEPDLIVLNPIVDESTHLERLAVEVLPAFRDS
jgi:probable F420-dependent oxidoreductase